MDPIHEETLQNMSTMPMKMEEDESDGEIEKEMP